MADFAKNWMGRRISNASVSVYSQKSSHSNKHAAPDIPALNLAMVQKMKTFQKKSSRVLALEQLGIAKRNSVMPSRQDLDKVLEPVKRGSVLSIYPQESAKVTIMDTFSVRTFAKGTSRSNMPGYMKKHTNEIREAR